MSLAPSTGYILNPTATTWALIQIFLHWPPHMIGSAARLQLAGLGKGLQCVQEHSLVIQTLALKTRCQCSKWALLHSISSHDVRSLRTVALYLLGDNRWRPGGHGRTYPEAPGGKPLCSSWLQTGSHTSEDRPQPGLHTAGSERTGILGQTQPSQEAH